MKNELQHFDKQEQEIFEHVRRSSEMSVLNQSKNNGYNSNEDKISKKQEASFCVATDEDESIPHQKSVSRTASYSAREDELTESPRLK
jgi:hypothetical protein